MEVSWDDWVRGSRWSRRSTRPTSRASASRSRPSSRPARGSSTSTSATGTSSRRSRSGRSSSSGSRRSCTARAALLDCHLMVDNPDDTSGRSPGRAATASRSTTRSPTSPWRLLAACARARPRRRARVQPGDRAPSRPPRWPIRRSRPLHEHPPGLLGSGVHARGVRRGSSACAPLLAERHIQVDGGIGRDNIAQLREAGPTCSSRARGLRRGRHRRGVPRLVELLA